MCFVSFFSDSYAETQNITSTAVSQNTQNDKVLSVGEINSKITKDISSLGTITSDQVILSSDRKSTDSENSGSIVPKQEHHNTPSPPVDDFKFNNNTNLVSDSHVTESTSDKTQFNNNSQFDNISGSDEQINNTEAIIETQSANYSQLENYQQNYFSECSNSYAIGTTDNYNHSEVYDLSRSGNNKRYLTSDTGRNSTFEYINYNNLQHNLSEQQALRLHQNYINNHFNLSNTMKGNIMTMHCQNYILSSSSSSSSPQSNSYYHFDLLNDTNNNQSNHINNNFYHNSIDDVINETLKDENCSNLVEDTSAHYTTLTNAGSIASPLDLYHLHQYSREDSHNNHHSTSSNSRSPTGYSNDDYDNGLQNFAQLTNLANRGIYASSPLPSTEHTILQAASNGYDTVGHGIPSR